MKVLYIEAKKKQKSPISIDKALLELPKELFLAYSVQYKELAVRIKEELSKKGFSIIGFQQVLGCTKLNQRINCPILLIGSGRFHALNLALQSSHAIYIYAQNTLEKIDEKEIFSLKTKRKAQLAGFLSADKIGILISTKPGQQNLARINLLKEKYPGKNYYSFISNTTDTREFENFDIDAWVNTACAGMANDSSKIINIDDILEII